MKQRAGGMDRDISILSQREVETEGDVDRFFLMYLQRL